MKMQLQPLTPAALYARVSSDRQDVDLSVAAQLRDLRDYARNNGYSIAREYVDEAESGRIADRPQFRQMIDEGGKATAPFQVILVWKFSRFTRKREHAVAFKSMLRRKGIRVVSITEHADDSPTGKLMEAIIESVDEFYSENLAQEVVRGMREAASRGYFLASRAPFGYNRIKVSDGVKDRPTLEVDPVAAPIVKEIFESSRRGNGLMEICKELNGRGITNKGRRWQKNVVHYLLTNEAYTGTAVWGVKSKDEKAQEPVRVEDAWPALVSRETFDLVQQGLHERAPARQRPARVGSQYLLSSLLRCGVCGKPYSAQGAKSGQFAYYICATLFREGAGACTARYLNASKVEDLVIEKVRERILTEETITELVTLVAEEIDNIAGEVNGRLTAINSELSEVEGRLENLYQALETKQLPIEALSPRYYLSNTAEDTPLETLAYVGGSRWPIETEFETEKGDVGLDEYETRSWAGWHHHIAMCLLGGAFLLGLQQDWGEKDAPDHPSPGVPGGAGDAAPGTVRTGGVAAVAGGYAATQRAGAPLPRKTPLRPP